MRKLILIFLVFLIPGLSGCICTSDGCGETVYMTIKSIEFGKRDKAPDRHDRCENDPTIKRAR